ncbi:MAG: exosortase system-associated protein, TIGR04073 family [Victivallales bacterium]|jgi:putative exosortase-associated protein (TIGR04073 family)|nr:exosortase system-associated protein, TIGR04073 family [Victivallales bacterium]MBT7161695.1 exosortase system-associated protein, TIGR04073 family [Victivallales bacterium]MBT7298717.1 exosortase system-associated protein, TIGR04073 family [Victivallales bacterium]
MMTLRRGKQFIAMLAMSSCLAGVAGAGEADFVNDFFVRCELYVWNRFADFLETSRGGLAVGPAIGAEIAITEYAQLGAYTANEHGVSFPVSFPSVTGVLISPPLWTVPFLEGKGILTKHQGKYSTASFGPRRRESSIAREVRFKRQKWDVRAQVGLGLVHAYYNFDTLEAYDFLAGIFTLDPKHDDERLDPTVIRRPARQLGRGFANVVGAPMEIPHTMIQVTDMHGDFAGATTGVAKGLWRFAIRGGVGIMEIVSFPMGWNNVIEPEYPFQPVRSTEWRMNRPDFRERL